MTEIGTRQVKTARADILIEKKKWRNTGHNYQDSKTRNGRGMQLTQKAGYAKRIKRRKASSENA